VVRFKKRTWNRKRRKYVFLSGEGEERERKFTAAE